MLLLNALTGHMSQDQSALFLTPPPPDPAFAGAPAARFADVQALIDRMKGGDVSVLFVQGNPLHELPVAAGFAEGLAKVPFVVSFGSEVDETAVQADLILPDHSYLESWGYQLVSPPGDRPALSGQQPVVSPLYDTRATTDVLLDLAQRLGGPVKTSAALAEYRRGDEGAHGETRQTGCLLRHQERRHGVGRLAAVRRLVAHDGGPYHAQVGAAGAGDPPGAAGRLRRLAR